MIKARTISQIQRPLQGDAVGRRKPNPATFVPDDVRARIVELYQGGMSMRRIGELLVSEGVEAPPTTIPWGTGTIKAVLNADK